LYPYSNESINHLRKVLFILFLLAAFFGCGSPLSIIKEKTKVAKKDRFLNHSYKFYSFEHLEGAGNFITYKFIYPFKLSSGGGKKLSTNLNEYENIIDIHSNFKNTLSQKNSKQSKIFSKLGNKIIDKESIKEKNIDIEIIKNLTKKYELWGPEWDKKVDRVSDHISMNDIRSIRGEIKRIYRKL